MKQADEERKQSRLLDQLDIAAASSKMKLGIAFTSDAEFRFLLLGAGINQASDQATAWRLRAAEISQEKSQPGSTVFRFLANMNRHIGEQEAVAALARTQWKADEKRRNTLYVYFQPDGGETRGLAVTNWEGARVIQSQLEKADLAIAQSREPSFMGGVFKGLRIAGNVAQIAIGAAWIYTTGGLGAYAGGSYLVLRGADGLLSELTGQETLSSRALRAIGGDDFGAAGESVLAVTDIILSLKAPLGKLKVGQELDFAASLGKGGRIGQLVVDGGGLALSASHIGLQVADVVEVSADVAKVLGLGTSSGRLIMMMQTQRTPAENRQARNRFKNNKDAARGAWEEETGQKWPTDENGNLWPAEHAPPLKEGGDPMRVKPRDPGLPDPHNIPGSDGLTDYQRWGALGTPARVGKK
jgi:hypothetical protein